MMTHSSLSLRELIPSDIAALPQEGELSASVNVLTNEFTEGRSRPEWSFVAEQGGRIVGLLGYRAPAAHPDLEQTPDTLIISILDLPWDSDFLEVGAALLEWSFAKLRSLGVSKVKWDFDSADFWSETLILYPHSRKNLELAHQVGMSLRQEKINYLYTVPDSAPSMMLSRLTYRTLQEVGEAAYIEALRLTAEGTLDQNDAESRRRFGPEQAARRFFDGINDGMTYEPRLWKLGYTVSGSLAGLIAPLKMWGDIGTLGYIGVVPEHRGNSYAADLLQQGVADLQAEGIRRVIADTDALNVPMQRTFEKTGYRLQGQSWSYEISLAEERPPFQAA